MHLIRYDHDGFRERVKEEYNRTEDVLIPTELIESCVAATVRMKRGFETEMHTHKDEEQIFIFLFLSGKMIFLAGL